MDSIKLFGSACYELAKDFMKLKLWDEYEEGYEFWDYWEYFVWDDFDVFSDGSDYYHWNLSDLYLIVKKQIPYEIATEHADWSIENEWNPDWWVNLKYYYARRKWNDMPKESFQRMLQREYYKDRADRLTDEYQSMTEKQMEEIRRKFEKDLRDWLR